LHRAGGRARTDHVPGAREVGPPDRAALDIEHDPTTDRKSTRLHSSHTVIYTLPLHDALPICLHRAGGRARTDHVPGAREVGPPDRAALDIEHDPTTRRIATPELLLGTAHLPVGL